MPKRGDGVMKHVEELVARYARTSNDSKKFAEHVKWFVHMRMCFGPRRTPDGADRGGEGGVCGRRPC